MDLDGAVSDAVARSVTIGNHAPRIAAVTIEPADPLTGDMLSAVVDVYDPDGDDVVLATAREASTVH